MKAESSVQVIKNKKQCLQLCLSRTYSLVLITHFLRARWEEQVKLRARKVGRLERNLSTAGKKYTLSRSKNLLSRTTHIIFLIQRRRAVDAHFLIKSNCPESCNEFLDNYILLFHLRKCFFRIFLGSHFWRTMLKKKATVQFS